MSDLSSFNKVLNQRNKLLKDISFAHLVDTLPVWDMQLLEYGTRIIRKRKEFVEELNEIISEIHSKISGGREHLVLKYEPNITADLFWMNCCGHRIGI